MNQSMMRAERSSPTWLGAIGALLFLFVGLPLAWGGGRLISLGGSPYYLAAGLVLLVVAVLVWRGHRAALWLYATFIVGTVIWALTEVGFDCWGLLPRISVPATLGLWFAIPAVRQRLAAGARWPGEAWVTSLLFMASVALVLGSYVHGQFEPVAVERTLTAATGDPTQWPAYGNDQGGSRYSPAAVITPANVAGLKPAWTYRTGETAPTDGAQALLNFQSVPLKIDDSLYICTPHDNVIALDADTGQQIWRTAPPIDLRGTVHRTCRGLAYHAAAGDGLCAKRLLMGTIDDQLLAFDLKTGAQCPGFGANGAVDLKTGIGKTPLGVHFVTSPPTIVKDVAVVGAFVLDNQTIDAPPGVIRAYDVNTGALRWAWDVLKPEAAVLEPNATYPRGGPNMWSIASADDELGLVFVPTGNPSPDYFGGHRTAAMERYGSSIVALDAATGNVRWSFQTIHHDLWDYDVGSQPVLIDFPMAQGGSVPAVLAPTKRGEIFVLDRRTGKPLIEVAERPVPQSTTPGERASPTQPFAVDFPSFAPPDLSEASMWGVTPIDQLSCRINFRSFKYEGMFTPVSTQGSIVYPGAFGAIDWGGVSVDKARRIAIVNASWFPYVNQLIPRDVADASGLRPVGDPPATPSGPSLPQFSKYSWPFPQAGTPYAVDTSPFVSKLNFPCHAPPWGVIAAIDLDSRKVLWQQPFGSSRGAAPFGLELPVGIFNLGGAVSTAGGVTFIGAAIDGYLRAFDTATGRVLWKASLPAGGQSSPISYVSGKTGRQYVVMSAGGHTMLGTPLGDYVVAYALP